LKFFLNRSLVNATKAELISWQNFLQLCNACRCIDTLSSTDHLRGSQMFTVHRSPASNATRRHQLLDAVP